MAFKIVVRSQSRAAEMSTLEPIDSLPSQVDIDVNHEAVSEAIQGAVENAVQEVWAHLCWCWQGLAGTGLIPSLALTAKYAAWMAYCSKGLSIHA